jgi:hypothetical protein
VIDVLRAEAGVGRPRAFHSLLRVHKQLVMALVYVPTSV